MYCYMHFATAPQQFTYQTGSVIFRISERFIFEWCKMSCTYSRCARVLAGHMKADHFLSHDDVGYTKAIISHLKESTQNKHRNPVRDSVCVCVCRWVDQITLRL